MATHNIALIKLSRPFGGNAKPVDVLNDETLEYQTGYNLTGWGRTHEPGHPIAKRLQSMEVELVEDCLRTKKDNTLCMRSKRTETTKPCGADSGSPYTFRKNGIAVLVGIHSQGGSKGCKEDLLLKEYDSLATNVADFYSWIKEKMGGS